MIMMSSPSLAVNSIDVPGPNYIMWETVNAPRGMSASGLVGHIVRVNRLALEYKQSPLQNVVINCHGYDYGRGLLIGGKGTTALDMSNVDTFNVLKGKNIGTIWLIACQAAYGASGKQICQAIASNSGCQVVASDENQDVGVWGAIRIYTSPMGNVDEFEGTVYSFTLKGGMRVIDPHSDIYTIRE